MRALRRGVLSYWYATLEDEEAAAIEAATATWYVNILDESVFEKAFEEQYRQLRAKDRLGRVVMGLELIRNCETHAPVVFDGLLVDTHWYGVPISTDAFTVRRVFAWAQYDALPKAYRDRDVLSPSITDAQRRARGAVQDRYRKDVEGRPVIETLFDAMAFFHSLDTRLVGPPAPSLRWSFAEIPDTDPELAEPMTWYLARPLGLDAFEPFLPSLACRDTERRTAQWPPADRTLDARARQARKNLPAAPAREVLHVLMDDGRVIGYSGFTPDPHGGLSSWVARRRQVWQDVRKGYRYFVVHDDVEVDLQCAAMSESAPRSRTAATSWQTSPSRNRHSTSAVCECLRSMTTSTCKCEGTVGVVVPVAVPGVRRIPQLTRIPPINRRWTCCYGLERRRESGDRTAPL